jgi:hypothetical protein
VSHHHRRMRAQYNTGDDTRPTGPGGVRNDDPRRPGGADNTGPREGSHSFNPRPATKRWPRGRS